MKKDLTTIEVEGQHQAWSNELNEIVEELAQYEKKLTEIASPSNKKKIEHFQNQFFIQRNIIAELKNDIKKHDFAIERGGKKPFDPMQSSDLNYHDNIAEKVSTELKIIDELRKEFQTFLNG